MPGVQVNPGAVEAMSEVGVDIAGQQPKKLADDAVLASVVVITMGCARFATRSVDASRR